ncbi:uncharacterized protein LOC110861074 isoform X1 [Folsomia candida]|uniref:uncharacterized protein LOC110861074 isoform X1 n=1 Tax=Folsomia candida TaxID=158441 RepID=UPI001604E5FA|nr:uncharacterized protein LOC110861074 isoform X1 [Folsomia candida]
MGRVSKTPTFRLCKRSQFRKISANVAKFMYNNVTDNISHFQTDIVNFSSSQINPQSENQNTIEINFNEDNLENSVIESVNEFTNLSTDQFASVPYNLEQDLREWGVNNKITRSAFNGLLTILNKQPSLPKLPVDGRTLLATPTTSLVEECGGGQYIHFGYKSIIEQSIKLLRPNPKVIKIQINIDGLPLFKSSSKQFWPILGRVIETKKVFIIGLYFGNEKPSDVDNYLQKFVQETKALIENGVVINNVKYEFKLSSIVCDAPARAFVTGIKGHTGYYGCGKCIVKGKYKENRVVYLKTNSELRTNHSFRANQQPPHHNYRTVIENLPLDLVGDIPYEFMHLVCLGVTKKILKIFVHGKRKSYRLNKKSIDKISLRLEKCRPCVTSDFVRKSRPLSEVDRWKATEFRLFLLYTGPIVLKGIISEEYYRHFLVLSIAVRLLSITNQTEPNLKYAEDLLLYFVEQFKKLYGKENLSYNVHGLIHLTNDVRKHGDLNSFSAFPFENFLGKIKNLIKGSHLPLQQVYRRIIEQQKNEVSMLPHTATKNSVTFSNAKKNNSCAFKKIVFRDSIISNKSPDNIILLKTGEVVEVSHFVKNATDGNVIGRVFTSKNNFFEYPCNSSIVNIFEVDSATSPINTFNISDVQFKCVALKRKNKIIVIPQLHNFNE